MILVEHPCPRLRPGAPRADGRSRLSAADAVHAAAAQLRLL